MASIYHQPAMRIKLTGEQKRILALPLRNPKKIQGVAGSGKTTVAIYRAKHLIASDNDLFRSTRIGIFSFTNSLVKYVRSILGPSNGTAQITVTTFHKWAYDFLAKHGFWKTHSVADRSIIDTIIFTSLYELRKRYPSRAILQKRAEFYKEEFAWIKGKGLKEDDYFEAKRTGRGTSDRVTAQDKDLLWSLYTNYCKVLRDKSYVDFDDFAEVSLKYIDEDNSFTPQFSHIIIDE